MTKPEAGQWWAANEAKAGDTAESVAVRIEHILPNGNIVVETYPNKFFVWTNANAWHHEPRCTGWDWVVPEPQPAEDPDEWVVQDRVPVRIGDRGWWENARFPLPLSPEQMVPVDIECDEFKQGLRHGYIEKHLRNATFHVYCRRRDLPKVEQPEKTTTIQVNPGKGYRWLEDHEIVQPDDEVFNPAVTPCWVKPLTRAGSTVKAFSDDDYPVRRKVEQPEQWPKYWEKLDTADNKVAYVRQVSKSSAIIVYATGHESDEFPWCKDDNHRKQLTKAEAMALLKTPEPQPQKTRVRLWKNDYGSVMSNPDCEHLGWQEIHHDSEGFYVEGGQS